MRQAFGKGRLPPRRLRSQRQASRKEPVAEAGLQTDGTNLKETVGNTRHASLNRLLAITAFGRRCGEAFLRQLAQKAGPIMDRAAVREQALFCAVSAETRVSVNSAFRPKQRSYTLETVFQKIFVFRTCRSVFFLLSCTGKTPFSQRRNGRLRSVSLHKNSFFPSKNQNTLKVTPGPVRTGFICEKFCFEANDPYYPTENRMLHY